MNTIPLIFWPSQPRMGTTELLCRITAEYEDVEYYSLSRNARNIIWDLFGIKEDADPNQFQEHLLVTGEELFINVTNDLRRHYPQFLSDRLLRYLSNTQRKIVLVDDVTRPDEINYLRNHGKSTSSIVIPR